MFNEHPKLISTIKKSLKITKKLIKIRKLKDRQHNGKMKNKKGQTTIYKTLHKKTLDI